MKPDSAIVAACARSGFSAQRSTRFVPPARYPASIDLRALLGDEAWHSLPASTQARFAAAAKNAEYRGSFEEVRANFAGRLFAFCCRLVRTPVAPFTGVNVPATVHVFATRDGGTAWQRIYEFQGHKPCVVESIKRLGRDGGLVEALPARLHMALDVYARNGVLHFVSTGYYFEFGRLRITLPEWLPPGATHVEHIDHGDGSFRFTMSVRHPWFGEVFYQTGCFRAAEESA